MKNKNIKSDGIENITAKPRSGAHTPQPINYGTMNEKDAKVAGYTDRSGHAVSMAKKDVKGSPTGALTDVGAGRSSVVRSEKESNKTTEKSPAPRKEQAP